MRLFMIVASVLCAATLLLLAPTADAANKVDVFIYTDTVQWIGQAAAVEEAKYWRTYLTDKTASVNSSFTAQQKLSKPGQKTIP